MQPDAAPPAEDMADPAPAAAAPAPAPSIAFARASYPLRVIGLALGFVPLAMVLGERLVPAWFWIGPVLYSFVWPHLAWQLARRARDPLRREQANLMCDHFVGGMWIALMAFNLLPCVLMLTLMAMDSMVAGGPRRLLRGLLAQAAGLAIGLLLYGAAWQPISSTVVVLACLPLLVMHPLGVGWMAYRSLGKLQRQREELAHLSRHDGLSGLFNRRHWEQQVQAEHARFLRHGQPATLVLLDLDHFKRINDNYGHAVGDEVIRRFAARLRAGLRDVDLPGRYGGEEFGILMPQTRSREALVPLERLRRSLHSDPLLPGVRVTVSCGVAGMRHDIRSHEAWMRLVDQMLYQAKRNGRDRIELAGATPVPPRSPPASAQPAPGAGAATVPPAHTLVQALEQLHGSAAAVALYDAGDSLVLANAGFLALHAAPPDITSFGALMQHCHDSGQGPRIDGDDLQSWLRGAVAQRRSQPHRRLQLELQDGRVLRVDETAFDNGWLLWVGVPLRQTSAA